MVKKIIAMIILGMFFIAPYQVQAEESKEKTGGILSETTDQLLGTTENLVKTVQTTIQDVENVIPVLKPVTKVVSEVEKITLPIIEDVVIGVTDTTETTLTKVVEGVDKTVNTLPTVPVVTPIFTTTTHTLNGVVSEVKTVVNSSGETVKNVVDIVVEEKERNPIVEIPKDQAIVGSPKDQTIVDSSKDPIIEDTPPKTSIETIPINQPIENLNQDSTNLSFEKESVYPIIEKKTPIDDTVAIETVKEETSLTEVAVEDDLRLAEKDFEIYSNNMEVLDAKMALDNRIKIQAEVIQNKDVQLPVNPAIPLGPDSQMVLTSGITWNGQGNSFSSSGSFLSSGNDILLGFLPAEEMLKEMTKKKWYHKNSYAIIQWIHTPLRKPPELTPFLYVI